MNPSISGSTTPPVRRAAAAPAELRSIGERVERRLTELLAVEEQRWGELDEAMADPLRSLRRLVMAGGKRLRPAFCHWGFVGAGGDPDDPVVVDAGAAFELLQAFALVHDDVMDGSDTRRGTRTAHLEFAARHAQQRWGGEGRRFGEGVAFLIGDVAHVYADLLLADAPRPAIDVWNELRVELNVGQYLDIVGTARGDVDHAGARRIARYKSGKYTVERPLHLGAALAGRLAPLREQLSGYGDPLGEAFQLRDDILGAFGDSVLTGKPVGVALREGKPTPLLAVARRRAASDGDGGAARLLARVGASDLADDEIFALQDLLVASGARAEVEATIDALTATAVDALEGVPLTPEACAALTDLAHYIARREA